MTSEEKPDPKLAPTPKQVKLRLVYSHDDLKVLQRVPRMPDLYPK